MARPSIQTFDSFHSIRTDGGARRPRQGSHAPSHVAGLRFAFPRPALADVHVVDVEGRRVRTLACGMLSAGEHECGWDGLDDGGQSCPAGNYVLRLEVGDSLLTSRVVSIC